MRPPPLRRPSRAAAAAASSLLSLLLAAPATRAQADGDAHPEGRRSLADLSLEELMDETITSVSKRAQRLGDAAAAVFVLSNDDIRRSGATSVADALRLVPGLQVGWATSSQWAISARGFNSIYANKLLVLVDGRAVYTPLFAGVYWDLQQTMLEDVERIEVIRGPGAALWGANAVNGVINVVTRSAQDTLGGVAYAAYGGGGSALGGEGGLRYGARLGTESYLRAFGSYRTNDGGRRPGGGRAGDDWQSRHGGFRLDRDSGPDTHLTWQADASGSDFDRGASSGYNANTLARWTRRSGDRSSFEVQSYYDRTYRNEALRSHNITDILDLTFQGTTGLGERQDVVWGLGGRYIVGTADVTTPEVAVRHPDQTLRLFSAFVQDELRLVPDRFTLVGGVKLEHNIFTGLEVQPTLRAVLKPTPTQTAWAAVSRAVRTPSEVEGREVFVIPDGPPFAGPDGRLYVPVVVGNGNPESEVLWAYEVGYRAQPAHPVQLDLTAFYHDYQRLISIGPVTRYVPGDPFGTAETPWLNLLRGFTYGGEAVVRVTPASQWRLTATYSFLRGRFSGPPEADPTLAPEPSGHQLGIQSFLDLSPQVSVDAQLRHVGGFGPISAYTTADLRLSYRTPDGLELSLVGQNLLQGQHLEEPVFSLSDGSEVPRGFYAKVHWRF